MSIGNAWYSWDQLSSKEDGGLMASVFLGMGKGCGGHFHHDLLEGHGSPGSLAPRMVVSLSDSPSPV